LLTVKLDWINELMFLIWVLDTFEVPVVSLHSFTW
jgi:hypothetical protein